MLSSKWPEGRNLQQATTIAPVQIQLQDDNAVAMSLLMAILHQRVDLVEDAITVPGMTQLAIVADKYDCAPVLKYVSTTLFDAFSNYRILADPIELAEAAYRLDHPQAFRRITNILVRSGKATSLSDHKLEPLSVLRGVHGICSPREPFSQKLSNERPDVMARVEADAVKSLRNTIGNIALGAAQHMVPCHEYYPNSYRNDRNSFTDGCSARGDLAIKCLDNISAIQNWAQNRANSKDEPLTTLLTSLKLLQFPDIDAAKRCNHDHCLTACNNFVSQMRIMLDGLRKEAADVSAGVCLDCFKAKATGAGKCRLKH